MNDPLKDTIIALFKASGMTKIALARASGLDEKGVRRALDTATGTKVSTLISLAKAMGYRIVIGVEDISND